MSDAPSPNLSEIDLRSDGLTVLEQRGIATDLSVYTEKGYADVVTATHAFGASLSTAIKLHSGDLRHLSSVFTRVADELDAQPLAHAHEAAR